jgi:N-acyl homoserine lactone hydrolase
MALAFVLAACNGGAATKQEVRLHALDCGRAEVTNLGVFDRGGAYDGRRETLIVPCFLVRHSKGDLLWDTGLPDALYEADAPLELSVFRFSVPRTLRSQLDELGLAPRDIDYLALSHSHFDHAGNANDYATATWLVERAERSYMFEGADAERSESYAALEQARTVTFDEDYDVFGDGAVVIVRTPGHTPGHASLLLRLTHSGPVLLSGDLYHFAEARDRRTVPVFNVDPDETLRSMDRFENLATATGARVVVQHDNGDFAALPPFPSFLD